jgi:methyl-accepting chemotaxis protein
MKLPIQLRNSALIAAAIGATTAGVFLGLTWQPAREARRGFEQKAASLKQILAYTVKVGVDFDDQATVQKDLQAAAVEPSIAYARVYKMTGGPMGSLGDEAAKGAPKPEEIPPEGKSQNGVFHVRAKLETGDKQIGWLQLGFSESKLQESIQNTRRTSALVAALFALISSLVVLITSRVRQSRARLLNEIAAYAEQLRVSSSDILAISNQNAAGANQQAAAIQETQKTMEALVDSASKIADASQEVFRNAERTARTTTSIAESTKLLITHSQRIADISEVIRSISDKTDLLALNASLEGTKAGEAGRGFTLVAGEMRRLAESVMGAVKEIKTLAADIRAASQQSASSTEEGRKIAEQTSDSAREITLVTQQQQNATEQVTRSMVEAKQLLSELVEATHRTTTTAGDLAQLADSLTKLTAQVAVGGGVPGARQG